MGILEAKEQLTEREICVKPLFLSSSSGLTALSNRYLYVVLINPLDRSPRVVASPVYYYTLVSLSNMGKAHQDLINYLLGLKSNV